MNLNADYFSAITNISLVILFKVNEYAGIDISILLIKSIY